MTIITGEDGKRKKNGLEDEKTKNISNFQKIPFFLQNNKIK